MKKPFGEKAFETRVNKIKELEKEIEELTKKRDSIKEELKNSMNLAGESVHYGKDYVARLSEVSSIRLDTKKFKNEHFKLWESYSYPSSYVRFTIT